MQFDNYHIRLMEASDAAIFFDLVARNRKRLEDFFAGTVARTKTLEETNEHVQNVMRKQEEKSYFPFLIIDTKTGEIAGLVDVKNIDWQTPKAELGCFADVNHENRGISGRALKMVIDHLFDAHHFEKLFLRTHVQNMPARTLAEKCGFEIEGTLRNDYRTTSGKLVDLLYYGLLKAE